MQRTSLKTLLKSILPWIEILFIVAFLLFGCSNDGKNSGKPPTNKTIENGTVTDIDGNTYKTIKIGTQWWMAENLKVIHYRNGDPIPNITDDSEWTSLDTGAYCYYDNKSRNAAVYGALYNWYAVIDSRNIAPAGWHVPTDAEWQTLVNYLGSEEITGGKLKEIGTTHWKSPNIGATNESGFSARPGGSRGSRHSGGFLSIGYDASFWSATEDPDGGAWNRGLDYGDAEVYRYDFVRHYGFSVRCVKDN